MQHIAGKHAIQFRKLVAASIERLISILPEGAVIQEFFGEFIRCIFTVYDTTTSLFPLLFCSYSF